MGTAHSTRFETILTILCNYNNWVERRAYSNGKIKLDVINDKKCFSGNKTGWPTMTRSLLGGSICSQLEFNYRIEGDADRVKYAWKQPDDMFCVVIKLCLHLHYKNTAEQNGKRPNTRNRIVYYLNYVNSLSRVQVSKQTWEMQLHIYSVFIFIFPFEITWTNTIQT